jgi:hypothetical protein
MNIGTIVEGPTDRIMLKAIIMAVCPGEHHFFDLQPAGQSDSFGEMGTGWKGVRRWCQETWIRSRLEDIIYADPSAPLDALIIQLDADVALESDLQEGLGEQIDPVYSPCPPIDETADHLKHIIASWLQIPFDSLPSQLVFAIPFQDMENWLFAALFPTDAHCDASDYECIKTRNYPGYLLTLKKYGKILDRDGTTVKKSVVRYRSYASNVKLSWNEVCLICSQAECFHHDLVNLCQLSE